MIQKQWQEIFLDRSSDIMGLDCSALIPVVSDLLHERGIGDGYHTFDELYEHRHALFVTVCNTLLAMKFVLQLANGDDNKIPPIWRSKQHEDGSMFPGMFIAGIGVAKGEQITYHLPMSEWSRFERAETRKKAPRWDGHSSDDVIERLRKLA